MRVLQNKTREPGRPASQRRTSAYSHANAGRHCIMIGAASVAVAPAAVLGARSPNVSSRVAGRSIGQSRNGGHTAADGECWRRCTLFRRQTTATRRQRPQRCLAAKAVHESAYEPSPMDASFLQQELVVLAVIGLAVAYWWFVLVPNARVRLAVNKKNGALKTYLQQIKVGSPRRRWATSSVCGASTKS